VGKKSWRALQTVLLGFSPFILWEFFSIIYYGFPFPNTAYAKLNTGLARIDLLEMGYLYFINSIHWDPITLLVIFIAGGTSLHSGNLREKIVALGIFFYLFYVLWIGADFMSGRFFSGALLMAVVLFNRLFANLPLSGGVFVLLFFILFGMTSPTPTLTSIDDDSYSTGRVSVTQISDERSFFFQPSGLLYDKRDVASPFHHWVFRGMQMRQDGQRVSTQYNVGYVGYFAGQTTYIIDRLALTDPLLARMTPLDAKNAKPGHYEREIPEGYFKSVRDNQNRIEDDALAEYYEKIRIITRGSKRDWERLVIIWKMNTGQYDYLLSLNFAP
jgi:arabinofuranosyltransferase